MKKRLRKKLHLGEFKEEGFQLDFQFQQPLWGQAYDDFWDQFIEMIEDRGLQCGGGSGYEGYSLFVELGRTGITAERNREHILSWLKASHLVANVVAGPTVDAWHG